MKVLLVNASALSYNLAIAKAANYWRDQGAAVAEAHSMPTLFAADFDLVWISAIFSWDVPRAIEVARSALESDRLVEIGGPGTFGLRDVIKHAVGFYPQSTPDARFERQPGTYQMVFWSRGCPAKNCSLGFPRDGALPICSVPEMEGWRFTLYNDVTPARIILDNNLSALPVAHQEHIIERTLACGFRTVDANSGFEPRSIRADTITRWAKLPLLCWRFAYDEMAERPAVLRAMKLFDDAGIGRKKRHIYCLAGNEPIEDCERRVREIQSWGSLPIVQRRRPLDWQGIEPLPTLHDWTEQGLIDFQRWGNRLSGAMPFADYRHGKKDRDTKTISLWS